MIEHRVQAHPTHVPIGWSVDSVTERHVVSRYRLRDRAGRAADVKKSARHFLARADFGERPILLVIQIDLKRLPVRPHVHLRLHMNTVAAVHDRRKKERILEAHFLGAVRRHPAVQITRQRRVNPIAALADDLDFAPGR